jgi:hypothetical protein
MTQARIDITGSDEGFRAMLRGAQSSLDSFSNGAKSSLSGLGSSLSSVNGLASMLAGTLAVGFAKNAIDETVKFQKETAALARTLGITAAEASVLNIALGDIYQDAGALTGAVAKMTRAMAEDEDKIKALGVATRDSNGNFRNSLTVFQEVGGALSKFKEGTDRNIEAAKIFGKSWQDVLPLMKLTSQVVDDARQKAESLGLVLDEQSGKTITDYRASMNDVGDVLLGVKNAIAQALMPSLSWMGNWFASIGPGLVVVFKGAIGGLASAFDLLGTGVRVVWETINAFVVSVAEPIRALGAAFFKLLSGDFQGALSELTSIPKVISTAWGDAFGRMSKSATETSSAIVQRFTGAGAASGPRDGASGNSAGGAKGGSGKKDGEANRMAEWEAALTQQKTAQQEKSAANGSFLELTKAQELRYWQDIMALRGLSEKESIALRKKSAELSIALRKEEFDGYLQSLKVQQEAAQKDYATRVLLAEEALGAITQKYGQESKEAKAAMGDMLKERRAMADQQKKIDQDALESKRGLQLLEIESQRTEAQFKLDMGQITKEQLLEQERAFEQQKFQVLQQALEQRKLLVDPQRDPEAYAQLLLQLQELDAQHEAKKNELRLQTTLAATEATRGVVSELQSSWAGSIKGMMTGALTFAGGLRQMFKGVVDAVIGMLANIAAKWLLNMITQRVMGQITNRLQVASSAAAAGAAAFASTAAIPIIGPGLAPGAAAAAYAGTMAFQGLIPAAAKGFDIPFGSNPLTQLHQREMVLPADIADPMREGLAGGRSMGGGDTYHISALDARSFGDYLKDNAGVLMAAMKHGARRGFA